MDEMAISHFKARCLAVLERVRRTRQPLRITRRGIPIAEIVPPSPPERPEGWLGSMSSCGRIVGDLTAPVVAVEAWEAHRS